MKLAASVVVKFTFFLVLLASALIIPGKNSRESVFVVGDFDGDKNPDTVRQYMVSKRTGKFIDKLAYPNDDNDWENYVKWFYDQEIESYLALNKPCDTLQLGAAQDVYCLINVGDTNKDGKDELALVIDRPDFSRVNTCRIYSICKGKWTELKTFDVHEDAFDYTGNKMPVFTQIEGYLEKKKSKWFYKDYSNDEYESFEDVGKMKPLKVDECR